MDAATLLNQCRKPSGRLGRMYLWLMNRSHSRLTDWGLEQVSIGTRDTVLDVGCGGGRTVQKLASIAGGGKVYGVDFSEASVAAARRLNQRDTDRGHVEIRHGSVSNLPFDDSTFDVVTAVETHYYWPDLPADVQEVRRVLKPGGTFVLIAEAYKGGKHDRMLRALERVQKIMSYAHLTVDEHRQLLSEAGYSDVIVIEQYDKGWICASGRRPPSSSGRTGRGEAKVPPA